MRKRVVQAGFALLLAAGVACAESIRVAVYSAEPYVSISPNGAVSGVFPEVLNAVAAKNGWSLVYVPGSAPLGVARLSRGDVDLLLPLPWTPENAARFDLSDRGLITSWAHVYVAPNQPVFGLSDLAGKTVAVVKYDPYYQSFRALLQQAGITCEFVEFSHYDRVFEVLRNRWVDAGLVERRYGARYAARYGLLRTSVISPPLDWRIAAPRQHGAALLSALDDWIVTYQGNRSSPYNRALSDWRETGRPWIWTLVWQVLLCLALLLAAAAGVFLWLRARWGERLGAFTERTAALERQLAAERETAESLKLREKWYWILFNNTSDVVFAHALDPDGVPGNFVEVNDAASARFGYSRDELLTMTPLALEVAGGSGAMPAFSSEDLVRLSAEAIAARARHRGAHLPMKDLLEKREVVLDRTYRTRSGGEFPAEVTVHLIETQGRMVVLCTARDVTERRTTVDALRESEQRFRDFFAQSPIGVAIYDADRKLTAVNGACLRMFGAATQDEFSRVDLFADPGLTASQKTTLRKGGTVRFETTVDFDRARKDERLTPHRSGRAHLDVMITNLGLDGAFNPKGYLIHVQDATEQRRAEDALRDREKQLRQAQKMEAIGTLAGGIAHDFNNLLTPIIGYTEMTLMSEPSGQVRQYLEEVFKASVRARDLVQQILTFSRQSDKTTRPLRLGPIVKEVLKLLRASVPGTIDIRTEIRADQDILLGDPTEMHQVLMNLCTNAVYAMRERGGALEVQLNEASVDRFTRGDLSRLAPGPYLELVVSDTGTGIDKTTLDRIFEPFFTTKKGGEGSGMGLSVAHGIVSAMHGIITVESEVGKGSVFRVYFPREKEAPLAAPEVSQPVPTGTERVLFVDDEPDVVHLVQEMLGSLGYQAVGYTRSADALLAFQADPHRFDLVITDQLMPGMTGTELSRELTQLRPDVPVILCTGFSRTLSPEQAAAVGVREFLMKPIVRRQLAETVRRTLDEAARSSAKSSGGRAAAAGPQSRNRR